MMISEFRFRGPAGTNDEFIELFNAGSAPVNISGWLIRSSNNVQPPGFFTRATIPANTIVNPGCYYLVTNSAAGGFSGGVTPNLTYSVGIADDGGVALTTSSTSVIVDQVGQGTAPTAFGEGQRLPMVNTNVNRGLERRPGGAAGHVDTNDNFADFAEINPANPQNSSTCLAAFRLPHEVQGAGSASPLAIGTPVTVRGVVTARTANGFFLQTETGEEDTDTATSEGLFVSATGPGLAAAVVGRVVHATGLVSEANAMTQLAAADSVTDVGAAAVPAPVTLTSAELSDAGSPEQLERFEGMRISVGSLTAVSGTEGGAFFAVLTGQARTFREPGIAAGALVPACAIGPCNIPLFDGNPERLRVDSDGLEGVAPAPLSSGAIVTDVAGPLSSTDGNYTLLPETELTPSGGTLASAATAPSGNEFTVASFKLGAPFAAQLSKASLLIRNTLGSPDIIGVQDAADLATLSALAAAVDADAAAVGQPAPAYLVEQGFLLKQAAGRVTLLSTEHIDADPSSPVALRAVVSAPAQLPQTVTVIASHLDPFPAGDPSPAALAARQAQAEGLASYIQFRQSNDPAEAIVTIGDFNAHRFNDGYVDVVGTVLGTPVSPDQVATEPHDLVSPDLVSAGDSLDPSHRYSSIVNGNAQLFDHVVVSASVAPQFTGVAYPRVNADFPDTQQDEATVPNRLSDRDPVVAYFTFPPDVDAPALSFTPTDLVAEATSAGGASVNFAVPTASDNLDAVVNVTCLPSSGSQFALGSTGVTCSAQDVAGNVVEASFSVTVEDTTAPVIQVPEPIVVEATSSAGASVSFTVTATDLVTPAPVFGCSRPSGSTFPIGTSSNTCYAFDAAGNGVTTTFMVTVLRPAGGRMSGTGDILNGAVRTTFSFDVRDSADFNQRGSATIVMRGGTGRPDRHISATMTDVRLTNSLGYEPGRIPRSGVDTAIFSGDAVLNGLAGYRIELTASDRGEPGVGSDRFTLRLLAPDGTAVESASGALRSGNIQSTR